MRFAPGVYAKPLGMESGNTMVREARITTGLGTSMAKTGEREISDTKSPINILATCNVFRKATCHYI